MYVIVVGLNYKTAPIEIREKFVFSEAGETRELYSNMMQIKSIYESVIIGTCNRTEIYAVVDQYHTGKVFIKNYLAEQFGLQPEDFASYLYVKKGEEAVEHIYKVATGLDSMVIGETQILGQVKAAFTIAQQNKATGTLFNYLFKQVITFAKKVHSQTCIGQKPVSISYASIELAKEIIDLNGKKALVIGAGEMGRLAATYLYSSGVKEIMVANRTFEKAQDLASTYDGQAYRLDDILEPLIRADVVISSTGSDSIVVDKFLIEEAIASKKDDRPFILIDIAVPRDIELIEKPIENLHQYFIDDLKDILNNNIEERKKIAMQVNEWINIEVDKFYQWINTLGVVPLIAALRDKSSRIQAETMTSIENKLPYLSEKELKVIRKHTKSIVNQLIKEPIIKLKEAAVDNDAANMMESFIKLFNITEEDIKDYLKFEEEKSSS